MTQKYMRGLNSDVRSWHRSHEVYFRLLAGGEGTFCGGIVLETNSKSKLQNYANVCEPSPG